MTLTDIYGIFYAAEYIFYKYTWNILQDRSYDGPQKKKKSHLNKFKIEIIPNIFSEHIKLNKIK